MLCSKTCKVPGCTSPVAILARFALPSYVHTHRISARSFCGVVLLSFLWFCFGEVQNLYVPVNGLIIDKQQAKKAPYADPCDSVSTYRGFHLILQERASKNNTFIYVKIPEVSLLVSYKVCVSLFSSILVLLQCLILVLL